jgi:hypothetical protein
MINSSIIPLKEHFSALDDPRAQCRIEHLLIDIVLVTICAVICGADNWVEIKQLNYLLNLPVNHEETCAFALRLS